DAKSLVIAKKHRIELYSLITFTMVVVYTGALVRHVDANLVCPDWPFCFNDSPLSFSGYNFLQWVQMGHRLFAALLFIWTIVYFIKVIKNYRNKSIMLWGWIATLGLITMQVSLGALIIFTKVNLGITLLHALFISIYFGMISYFVFLSYRSARYVKNS